VKVGRKLRGQSLALLRAREEYLARHGCEPQLSVLCEMLGMDPEEAAAALTACSTPRSLEEKVGSDEDGMCLSQILPDPENAVEKITDKLALSQAVATLDPLQKQILYLRYVKELSQQSTGKLLGLSQVKISREEKKILALLRKAL
jgi:RNA polymerase sporulation-specific sigma factor